MITQGWNGWTGEVVTNFRTEYACTCDALAQFVRISSSFGSFTRSKASARSTAMADSSCAEEILIGKEELEVRVNLLRV